MIQNAKPSDPPADASLPTSYDAVAYPGQVHAQTHPAQLALVARLFGLETAPVTRCRVLELGCGRGDNLFPMAWSLPGSEFTGIDLAGTAIQQGRTVVDDLGLRNCRLVQGDLLEIDASWGEFDYIIAHGVYSWVPQAVREGLLTLCRKCLAPRGLAFVSYLAGPGDQVSQMLRAMMLHHAGAMVDPREKASQALALARLVAGALPKANPLLHQLIQEEVARFLEHDPAQMFHDELAPVRETFTFTEFMADARRHELGFVAEAELTSLSEQELSVEAQAALRELGTDRLRREQYRDFFKCRRFRQTLLTHARNPIRATPDLDQLSRLSVHLGVPLQAESTDLRPGVAARFVSPPMGQIELDFAPGKAALHCLMKVQPHALTLTELSAAARERLRVAGVADVLLQPSTLNHFVFQLAERGMVELLDWQPELARRPGARPEVHPLARWQIQRGTLVTTLRHHSVRVEDAVGRTLIELLDGTRPVEQLPTAVFQRLEERGWLGATPTNVTDLQRELVEQMPANLQKLADLGLLIA